MCFKNCFTSLQVSDHVRPSKVIDKFDLDKLLGTLKKNQTDFKV